MMPTFTADIARALMPLFILSGAGCLMLVWGAVTKKVSRVQEIVVGLLHLAVLASVFSLWNTESEPILGGMLLVDKFSLFFTALCTLCSLATLLISGNYLHRFGIGRAEYYGMFFFSLAGMFVLVSAYDLMSVFLGIELMSIAIYIVVAFRRRDFFSNEAALKYFLLGAFAIAFFLYGVSLIYGLCGTMNFDGIMSAVASRGLATEPALLLAVGMVMVGFIFKVSAVPFHMWVPDVYQGAPSPVTGFMASAVKAASFAAFLRLFYLSFIVANDQWTGVMVVLAILTMTVGNIIALVQRNIKRMLAYSSIAHAGYILVAMAALSADSTRAASAVMYYVVTYSFMTLGAFALVTALEKRGDTKGLELEDYNGLGLRRPFLGFAMTVFMLAMAGIPPTAGFFAKYYVFSAAIDQGLVTLAVIGVLNSALSLYYYLRVVVQMYFKTAEGETHVFDTMGVRVVIAVSLIVVIWLGLGPSGKIPGIESILDWTNESLARLAMLK